MASISISQPPFGVGSLSADAAESILGQRCSGCPGQEDGKASVEKLSSVRAHGWGLVHFLVIAREGTAKLCARTALAVSGQHGVDDDSADRNVKPERKGVTSDLTMQGESAQTGRGKT